MKINSKHLLIDLIDLDAALCVNIDAWIDAFRLAASNHDFRVVGENSHLFSPPDSPGMTAFIMLDTSHFSVHTYSNNGSAALDLFACTEQDLYQVWKLIKDHLCIPDGSIASSNQVERFTNG